MLKQHDRHENAHARASNAEHEQHDPQRAVEVHCLPTRMLVTDIFPGQHATRPTQKTDASMLETGSAKLAHIYRSSVASIGRFGRALRSVRTSARFSFGSTPRSSKTRSEPILRQIDSTATYISPRATSGPMRSSGRLSRERTSTRQQSFVVSNVFSFFFLARQHLQPPANRLLQIIGSHLRSSSPGGRSISNDEPTPPSRRRNLLQNPTLRLCLPKSRLGKVDFSARIRNLLPMSTSTSTSSRSIEPS